MAFSRSCENTDFVISGSDLQEINGYLQEFDETQQIFDHSEANLSTIKMAMARLEDKFRYLLLAVTSSNSSKSDENESYTDSSFSSTPSRFRLSVSTNFSLDEINDFDAQIEQPVSSENNVGLVPEHLHEDEEQQGNNNSQHLDFASIISIPELNLLPIQSDVIYYLRCIAQRMIAAGSRQDCIKSYSSIRCQAMEASLLKLGIETLSTQQIQMLELDRLVTKIRRWIKVAKVSIGMLFANEKMLVDLIFQGLLCVDTAEFCFKETVTGPAMKLLSFAETVTSVSRKLSPNMLFRITDLYEALSELLPEIEIIFEGKYLTSIHGKAVEILSKLDLSVRGILDDLENALIHEMDTNVPPGGVIIPLTRYVMNYMIVVSDYKQILNELIVSKPSTRYAWDHNTPDMDLTEFEGKTPLALHLIWIIMILQFKLDGKSKHYKDASLSHLFMMNNVHYIFRKIKGSPELREMIGDDYLKKLTGKLRLAATNYLRSTWVRVLNCLRDEGLNVSASFSSGVSRSALRERLKKFNAMFEEVHRTQAAWLVPDIQLREELRISISEKLIPAYRSFLGRFRSLIESGRHPENYIKYTVEELQNAVLDFFESHPVSLNLRRRSQPKGKRRRLIKEGKGAILTTTLLLLRKVNWRSGVTLRIKGDSGF